MTLPQLTQTNDHSLHGFFMCRHTLYVWVAHEVEETSEQGVGGSVSPSKVKI